MTVKDLKEMLEKCNDELEIQIYSSYYGHADYKIYGVKEVGRVLKIRIEDTEDDD